MNTSHNKIGIGTVQFGVDYGISNKNGKTPIDEVKKILEYANQHKILYLDTAYAYGIAEEVLGKFDLKDFRIVSKYIPKDDVNLEEQLIISLKKLRLDSLYGYLAHRALDLIADDTKNLKILNKYKKQGIIKRIGASFNNIEEIQYFLDKGIALDIVQVPYNYLDRRFEQAMKKLKADGSEIHTRSTFLQGLFFCKVDTLNPFFNEIKPVLSLLQNKKNLAAQLLEFVLQKDFVDVVNIGVNNLQQLKENIQNRHDLDFELPHFEGVSNHQILTPSQWPK